MDGSERIGHRRAADVLIFIKMEKRIEKHYKNFSTSYFFF
jgi:hypothetical protein